MRLKTLDGARIASSASVILGGYRAPDMICESSDWLRSWFASELRPRDRFIDLCLSLDLGGMG